MELEPKTSQHNYAALLWHASFLAFAKNFIDVDTIIPAMVVQSGGNAIHIGIITAIMMGGSKVTQLFFAPWISNYEFKKPFLNMGIGARIAALLFLSLILFFPEFLRGNILLAGIYLTITVFSVGGAFANISYTDILGKSMLAETRKRFFTIRQAISGIAVLSSLAVVAFIMDRFSYPENYGNMFLAGFIGLSIAFLGFWQLRENIPSRLSIKNIDEFTRMVRLEIKENKRLVHFLGFINTQGLGISILPFVYLYAENQYNMGGTETANFLIFKMVGNLLMGFLLFYLAKNLKYQYLLYLTTGLALLVPWMIFLHGFAWVYSSFFVGGVVLCIYSITMSGILLEVSGTGNRALYTGIAGAGNLLPAIFPLVGGAIIQWVGFQAFFVIYSILMLSSIYFIYNIHCEK